MYRIIIHWIGNVLEQNYCRWHEYFLINLFWNLSVIDFWFKSYGCFSERLCPEPPVQLNGRLAVCPTPYKYGSTCTFACSNGYQLPADGISAIECSLKTFSGGRHPAWDNVPTDCEGLYFNHRHQLHGLLSPRTATLELTADIVCSECFRFRYVTNVNHCIVPNALIVPRSKSMRSRPDNGKNVRQKHSVP